MTIRKHNCNRFMCLIIAITMLFSGMCTNNVKADSPFSYDEINSVASSILNSADDLSGYPEFLTEENSINRIISNTTRTNHSRENRNRTHMVLLVVNTISIFNATYSFVADIESTNSLDISAAIIYFIHDKDGKK